MRDQRDCSQGDFTISKRLVASASGGIITSLVMTPLDVVKIRMQVIVNQSCMPF